MAYFSAAFKIIMRHTVESALLATLLLGIALALTFLEDYCVASHRPAWFTFGVEVISVVAFIADATAWGLLAVVGIKHTFVRLFKK